jgi:hypothetical protein
LLVSAFKLWPTGLQFVAVPAGIPAPAFFRLGSFAALAASRRPPKGIGENHYSLKQQPHRCCAFGGCPFLCRPWPRTNYVPGYDTTAAGGTEIVTIKYSPVALQRHSDGTVLFQAQGAPGEAFDIEASTNLLDWLDLGTILADTNGLIQFDDTNAPNYPYRFYYTSPQ